MGISLAEQWAVKKVELKDYWTADYLGQRLVALWETCWAACLEIPKVALLDEQWVETMAVWTAAQKAEKWVKRMAECLDSRWAEQKG